jgi:hypothetical protein
MNGAYEAVGDVGSAWIGHIVGIPKGLFTSGILMRHPARMLNTRLKVFKKDKSFTAIDNECLVRIKQTFGIEALKCSEMDQMFLQDLYHFATQIKALNSVDVVMRLEDMNSDTDYCGNALHRLTGLYYERTLVQPMVTNPVNRRTEGGVSIPSILGGFTEQQRGWYRLLLQDSISITGYDLEGDSPEPRPSLAEVTEHSDLAESGDEKVTRLQRMVADKDRQIARLCSRIEQLEKIWDAVQSSAGWRLMDRWRRARRRLLPAGSRARQLYDLFLRRF